MCTCSVVQAFRLRRTSTSSGIARSTRPRIFWNVCCPSGCFQLIINLAAGPATSIVMGTRTRHSILETASIQSVIGVVFRPGGAQGFFEPAAYEFYDRAVQQDQLWNSASGKLHEGLVEAPGLVASLRVLEAELQRRLGKGVA